jgi:hypothetical protein
MRIPPPTLIVCLWIYTEHVMIAGHNGVRTAAWCSYCCETRLASWLAWTAWHGRTRLSVLEQAAFARLLTLPGPELVRTKKTQKAKPPCGRSPHACLSEYGQ